VRIFLAGATGVIGTRLIPLLVEDGHVVAGMTRSAERAGLVRDLGAEPVVCDVYDLAALTAAMTGFRPDVVLHQLTDLPDDASDIPRLAGRNQRMRDEGTANLLAAAHAAGAARVIAQSISWELPGEEAQAATGAFERTVLRDGGVIIRYGQFWGPGTYYPDSPPPRPRIHLDDAARQTVTALGAPPGLTLVADDRAS
jgi:nucleoside-diphosphate-sugar epimerase